MAHSRMSSRDAIFMALLSITYVTGFTDTIDSHVELAAYGLADVAHIRRLEVELRSGHRDWYCKGMQIFAYRHLRHYWEKKKLTWALMTYSTVIQGDIVIDALEAGFEMWAEHSQFTFKEVKSRDQPDIRVWFVPEKDADHDSSIIHNEKSIIKDREGVIIQFADTDNWMEGSDTGRINFRLMVLYQIGHALGLGDSDYEPAVMAGPKSLGATLIDDPELTLDDIDAIRTKYGFLPSGKTTLTFDCPSSSSSD